jgi:hypothetical protein
VGRVIQTVSIAVTAYFAVAGLRAWRAQIIGQRRFEIAEEAVLAAHRVKESLRFIRTPGSMREEVAGRQCSSDETPEQATWYDTYFIIFAREEIVREDFAQLAKSRLLCRVHFGEEAVKPFDDLLAVRAKVLAHAVALMNLGSNQVFTCSELPKLQGVVFGNQNAIAATVDGAVLRIETICRQARAARGPIAGHRFRGGQRAGRLKEATRPSASNQPKVYKPLRTISRSAGPKWLHEINLEG